MQTTSTTLVPFGIESLLMLAITYMQALTMHIYICTYIHRTQGWFKNHTDHRLYKIMVWANSLMRWGGGVRLMKVGNIARTMGIEPTSLAFWLSVLTIIQRRLSDITTLPMPTGLCASLPERPVQLLQLTTQIRSDGQCMHCLQLYTESTWSTDHIMAPSQPSPFATNYSVVSQVPT